MVEGRRWTKTYLEAFHKAEDLLIETDIDPNSSDSLRYRLREQLGIFFEYYYTYFPGSSKDQWLIANTEKKISWFTFEKNGGE